MKMWLKLLVLICALSFALAATSPGNLFKIGFDTEQVLKNEEVSIVPLTDPFDKLEYRLPNNTKPLRYDIRLSTDIHKGNFTFEGRVTIQIEAIENSTEITLHYRQLTIVNVALLRASGATIQSNVPFSKKEDVEFLIITPTQRLIENTIYSIVIDYIGELRDDDAGFYRSSYVDISGSKKWLATTQFESTDARHAFPCYDEPAIRSAYSIEIQHDASYMAISNMPEASRVEVSGSNYVVTKFDDIESVQSYLIAFTISDFLFVQDSTGKVTQRVYAKPQSIADGNGKFALQVSRTILEGFEEYLNTSFSLPKMDQAAIPDFAAGAMENWGLVTYREQQFLFNEATGTTRNQESIITTIAHEFAHQWFGDLVSPAWWSFLWLNEGFATLYGNHILEVVYPGEKWADTFLIDTVQPVMENDASVNIRPMSYYVENPDRISGLFDNVAYSKSGSVLRMFQHALGDSTWRKGLSKYLAARGFNSAVPDHLYAGLQEAVNEDNLVVMDRPNVAAIMKTWETQSGFPYVTVTRNGSSLTFAQNRFLYGAKTSENLWWIPINYVVGSNANFENSKPDFWLQGVKSVTLPQSELPKAFNENDWIVANIQQSGYYRVNYDEASWRLIIKQLNLAGNEYDKIHIFNRAQLVDDSFHLARAELINYNTVFGVMDYLEREIEFLPWASANRANTLLNRWLTGSSAYENYQTFMRKNVQAIYLRHGVNIIEKEPRVDRYARNIAINIACQAQHEVCLNQTKLRLQQALYSEVQLPADVISIIYCNGIRSADDALFTSLQNKMTASTVNADRNMILTALGCVQDQKILADYFEFAINAASELTNSERSRILSSAVSNGEESLRTLITFVRSNYQSIRFYNLIQTVCSNIASRISSQSLLDLFNPLLTTLQTNAVLTESQATNYRNNANTIINWQLTNLKSVEMFFKGEEDTTLASTAGTTPTTTPSSMPTTVPSSTPALSSTQNPPTVSTQGTTESTTLGAGSVAASFFVLSFSLTVKYLL